MPPPRFDADAEVWIDVCPWCGQLESHQVGTETAMKVVVWCRSCSGSSWLHRGAHDLQARTPPKWLHDKRRPRTRQREPFPGHASSDQIERLSEPQGTLRGP